MPQDHFTIADPVTQIVLSIIALLVPLIAVIAWLVRRRNGRQLPLPKTSPICASEHSSILREQVRSMQVFQQDLRTHHSETALVDQQIVQALRDLNLKADEQLKLGQRSVDRLGDVVAGIERLADRASGKR